MTDETDIDIRQILAANGCVVVVESPAVVSVGGTRKTDVLASALREMAGSDRVVVVEAPEVPSFSEWRANNRAALADEFAEQYGHQIHEWPDFIEAEYEKAHPLPELPQGLRSPLLVVAYKGETGNRSMVLRDLNTQATYRLEPSTIEGWEIPGATAEHHKGHSIIVTLTPSMVALHLPTGELYRDTPPPRRLNKPKKGRSHE